MKRVDRSVVLLTMSALDTLATAIGVFVLLVALLMPYYQNSFDLEETITQLRVAHEQKAAQLQDIKAQIAEESAKAAAALMEAQQVSAEAAAIEAKVQRQPEPSPKPAKDTKGRVVDALDLVFVIDTTASMGPVIRDLAASIRSIVPVVERMVPSVRIGISAYKDHDIPLPPVITFPLTPPIPICRASSAFSTPGGVADRQPDARRGCAPGIGGGDADALAPRRQAGHGTDRRC